MTKKQDKESLELIKDKAFMKSYKRAKKNIKKRKFTRMDIGIWIVSIAIVNYLLRMVGFAAQNARSGVKNNGFVY